MTHAQLAAWIVTLIVGLRAPGTPSYIPDAQETRQAALNRYAEIADAVATVSEQESIYPGARGPSRTAALLVAIAYHESGFRRDIDMGLGREKNGRSGENDHGRSWCMMQMHLGKRLVRTEGGEYVLDSGQNTMEGWSGRDLVGDRVKCFTAGRNAIKRSMSACSQLPAAQRLAAYAAGVCDSETGKRLSATRMRTAWKIWDRDPPPRSQPVATADPLIP